MSTPTTISELGCSHCEDWDGGCLRGGECPSHESQPVLWMRENIHGFDRAQIEERQDGSMVLITLDKDAMTKYEIGER